MHASILVCRLLLKICYGCHHYLLKYDLNLIYQFWLEWKQNYLENSKYHELLSHILLGLGYQVDFQNDLEWIWRQHSCHWHHLGCCPVWNPPSPFTQTPFIVLTLKSLLLEVSLFFSCFSKSCSWTSWLPNLLPYQCFWRFGILKILKWIRLVRLAYRFQFISWRV